MEFLYNDVMLAAACCMIVIGIILAAVKTPQDEPAAKFRVAKHAITVAVVVLGALNLVQIAVDPQGDVHRLGGTIALAVSYLQAMLFTMAVMVLIKPDEVTARRLTVHLTAIIAVDVVLLSGFFMLPRAVFIYVYVAGILLYICLLIYYSRWYVTCYRHFVRQLATFYEEDEIERGLRWLNVIFWVALAVGVLSLLMLVGSREVDLCLTVALALFYALLAACFINYELSAHIILPVLAMDEAAEETVEDNIPHPDRLMAWIERGGYLNTSLSVKEIAAELDMSVSQFRSYFRKVTNEDFRTWRVRKRVEHARRLMSEHPDWSVTRVVRESGFNDRSYFYQQFLLYTGVSVTDYRNSHLHN